MQLEVWDALHVFGMQRTEVVVFQIQNFAFEEHLVRVVERDGRPWFVGKDVCASLEIAKHHQALEALDLDERGTSTVGTPGGEQTVTIISEPGVYRLVFRSRKPEAERFKRWLAHDVLPQLRKTGSFAAASDTPAASRPDAGESDPLYKLNVVREARLIFGADRARGLWVTLGLPMLPPPPPTLRDEAYRCLRHLLDAAVHEDGPPIRDCLEAALDDGEGDRLLLSGSGIKALADRDAFVVANRHDWLLRVFVKSDWSGGRHARVLRRLSGVTSTGPMRHQGRQCRGTLIPAGYLDQEF